jgi:uncharacterized FlgJ-related protein
LYLGKTGTFPNGLILTLISMKKFISVCSITTFLLLASIPIGSYLSLKLFVNVPDYEIKNDNFNEKKLISYIKELRIKYPHIVLAQAKLESGNFNSILFKKNNNLFGMKHPKMRTTTSKGSKFGYAYYSSWRESVLDYALYSVGKTKNITSEEDYYKFLGDLYAENQSYIELLKNIVEKNNLKKIF